VDLNGARGVIVNITASNSLRLRETNEVINTIRHFCSDDATIIHGTVFDDNMADSLRVTVVATGIGRPRVVAKAPVLAKAPLTVAPPQHASPNGAVVASPGGTHGLQHAAPGSQHAAHGAQHGVHSVQHSAPQAMPRTRRPVGRRADPCWYRVAGGYPHARHKPGVGRTGGGRRAAVCGADPRCAVVFGECLRRAPARRARARFTVDRYACRTCFNAGCQPRYTFCATVHRSGWWGRSRLGLGRRRRPWLGHGFRLGPGFRLGHGRRRRPWLGRRARQLNRRSDGPFNLPAHPIGFEGPDRRARHSDRLARPARGGFREGGCARGKRGGEIRHSGISAQAG